MADEQLSRRLQPEQHTSPGSCSSSPAVPGMLRQATARRRGREWNCFSRPVRTGALRLGPNSERAWA
eukprot:419179-Alexandrium_andersonii.AAC.1